MNKDIKEKLDYLRGEIEKECISYEEIAELQELAEHIPEDDVVLREWAGIPEHEDDGEVRLDGGATVRAMPLDWQESIMIEHALDELKKTSTSLSVRKSIDRLKKRLNQTFAGI